jgi:hypothetical protein
VSGEVATPISPIPPERASGEIRRKGTAVVTTLIGSVCALTFAVRPHNSRMLAVSFKAVSLIRKFLVVCKYSVFDQKALQKGIFFKLREISHNEQLPRKISSFQKTLTDHKRLYFNNIVKLFLFFKKSLSEEFFHIRLITNMLWL